MSLSCPIGVIVLHFNYLQIYLFGPSLIFRLDDRRSTEFIFNIGKLDIYNPIILFIRISHNS